MNAGTQMRGCWRNVSIKVIANSGHQVVDEPPAAVAELPERYAAR
jgi:hypothetical protein